MKNKIINLKKVILAGAFFLALNAFGQTSGAPEKMSYQAVVRNTTNNLVTNQAVGMRVSILQGSMTGTAVFTETQTSTANANGLVSFEIGGGNPVTGTFAAIDWANGPYFVKTETDPTGGSNYTIVGVSQLLSTPYALYAKTSGSSTPGPQGSQGIAGPQGPAGMNGLDGATGPMGPQGPQGPMGEQGIAGPQGPAGMNGLNGATGPMGPQGPQGPAGEQGIAGPQGAAGATGATGPQGNPGPVGPQGPAGATGQGVPAGGTTGQVLSKVDGTDYNTQWVTPSSGGSSSYKGIVLDVAHTLPGISVTTGINIVNYSRELSFKSSDVITAPPSSVGTFTAYCPHTVCGVLESGKSFSILTNGPTASSFTNHAFTAIEPGYYQINCEVVGIGATSANPQLQPIIVVNSPGAVFKQVVYGTVNSNGNTFSNNTRSRGMVSAVVKLNTGDYVGTVVFNLSNAATGTLSSDGTTRMTIVKL